MDKITDKDKYTYVTIKWSTYEMITSETDGDEYDGDENDTYEEDNYITKCIEHNHVVHFNVNLPVKKFIDKVVPYNQRDLSKGNRIYFDRYTSIELDGIFRKQIMMKYVIPMTEKSIWSIELKKGRDKRIETLVL